MRSLCARQDHVRCAWRNGGRRRQAHLNALVSHEPHTSAPVFSSAPIVPEQRGRADDEWMQKDTHLARLCCRAAMPLTLLAQRTRAATVDAGAIHQAQASIGFSALLLDTKLLVCGTAQCSVWLEREIVAREATSLPCGAHLWRGRARGRSCVWWRWWQSRSKLGRAHWLRFELVSQFQAEVPHPLRDQLPALLSPGRVRAPTVRVLFAVFV
jgi:hypothetical protein